MTSLISSISWIPRGAAKQNPTKYSVDEAELERIGQLARGQLEGAKIELELAKLLEKDDGDDGQEGEWEESVCFSFLGFAATLHRPHCEEPVSWSRCLESRSDL